MLQTFDNEATLIKLSIEHMLVKWGASQPLRTGLHASSVLVSDADWCVREHVLSQLFSDQARKPELQPWDWKREAIFENGWDLHKRWQRIFLKHGKVVQGQIFTASGFFPEPELDLTHYDETREVYFSPDAILQFGPDQYVVEIKGIKQEAYEQLTDSLEEAMKASETVNKAFYQCQLYMHLLQIKKGIILVENKNNQDFRVWVIQYDPAMSVKYIQRLYDVKGAAINARVHGRFPTRICKSRGDTRARQCPMREVCFRESEG